MARFAALRPVLWMPACAGMTRGTFAALARAARPAAKARVEQIYVWCARAGRVHAAASLFVVPAKAGTQACVPVVTLVAMDSLRRSAVYVLVSRRNGTLYTGVMSDRVKRVWQHRNALVVGFSAEHGVHALVSWDPHATMEACHHAGEAAQGSGTGPGSCA